MQTRTQFFKEEDYQKMLCFPESDAATLDIQGERFSKLFRSIDLRLEYCDEVEGGVEGVECASLDEQLEYWKDRKINMIIIIDHLMVDMKNRDKPLQNITKIMVETIREQDFLHYV